jgi:AraC-type DNA-binding domain-containing proteins
VSRAPVDALPFASVRLSRPVRHYRCPRDWSWHQRLDDHDLWLVLAGRGTLKVNEGVRPLVAPVATLLMPGDVVVGTQEAEAPLEVIALHFTPGEMRVRRRGRGNWGARLGLVPLRPAGYFRELGEQLAIESAAGDAAGAQIASALAVALLGSVWRLARSGAAEEGDDRVDELVRRVQREPWREWTLGEMARQAGMGTTKLNERMRQLTGFSPTRWVIRCRLERACVLLAETELKLASVADACGYRDVYFFARQFRQVFRCPPAAWRKSAREERK